MGAFTFTNKVPVVVDIHPPVVFRAGGAQAGKRYGGGAWRGVRGTLTGSAAYAVGGDTLPDLGLKRVEALLVVAGDDVTANNDGLNLRFVTSGADAGKVQIIETDNTEIAAAADAQGASWEVLILGR